MNKLYYSIPVLAASYCLYENIGDMMSNQITEYNDEWRHDI